MPDLEKIVLIGNRLQKIRSELISISDDLFKFTNKSDLDYLNKTIDDIDKLRNHLDSKQQKLLENCNSNQQELELKFNKKSLFY